MFGNKKRREKKLLDALKAVADERSRKSVKRTVASATTGATITGTLTIPYLTGVGLAHSSDGTLHTYRDPSRMCTTYVGTWVDASGSRRIQLDVDDFSMTRLSDPITHIMEVLYAQGFPRPGGTPQVEGAERKGVTEIRNDTGPPGSEY